MANLARSIFPAGADVAAAQTAGPVDLVHRAVGTLARPGEIAAERGDAEDAAGIGQQAVAIAFGAGMEDLDLGLAGGGVEPADFAAALRVVGIAVGGHHHAKRRLVMP